MPQLVNAPASMSRKVNPWAARTGVVLAVVVPSPAG
jgi:hypothetical protein